MRNACYLWLILLWLAGPALEATAGNGPVLPIRRSLVRISATMQAPEYRLPWAPGEIGGGVGSGFVIAGNRILTNAHVVSNARFLVVDREGDPRRYPARVQFIAHDCDLAILQITRGNFYEDTLPLELGDVPEVDSEVVAYGYPIGGERLSATRGIVSRVEFRTYSHSGMDAHLCIQIDAAINPGNSGGPVLRDGKVVGVAFQGFSGNVAQNVGYMIPTPVIRRFLEDIKDDRYDGYVELGIRYLGLENPGFRRFLGLPDNNLGVYVTDVISAASAAGKLARGDVLLAIDGHPILDDGQIRYDGDVVQLEEVVERKFSGDKVSFDLLRAGRRQSIEVVLKTASAYRLYSSQYDVHPEYLMYAGLVFQPVDRNFLAATRVDNPELQFSFDFYIADALYEQRPQLVVIGQILADPINSELEPYRGCLVQSVDGKPIRRLADLKAALDAPAPRHVIGLQGEGRPIVLEHARVEEAQRRIRERYQVTADSYLEKPE